MSKNQAAYLILALSLLTLTQEIFLQLTPQSKRRCFFSELSPDKTLDARFGLLRRDKEQCRISFQIQILDDENKVRESVHRQEYFCSQAKVNEPHVAEYHGAYELCLEVVELSRPQAVELFIGQKLNPMIYHHSETEIPLVQAAELYEVEGNVHTIKKTLVRIQRKAEESKLQGDLFDVQVDMVLNASKVMTLVHIAILVVFGAIWVYLVKQLKRSD